VQTKQSAPARGKGAINRQQNGLLPPAISRFHQIARPNQRKAELPSEFALSQIKRT
jgi:hypothetical protein